MATMHAGKSLANATMVSGRMRRRLTTAPLPSSAARLQLFLPRSIPMTAILAVAILVPLPPVAQPAYAGGWRGGPFHKSSSDPYFASAAASLGPQDQLHGGKYIASSTSSRRRH